MTEEVWIFDGIRTAFGKKGGALASVRVDNLAAAPLRALVERNQLPDDAIEDVLRLHVTCRMLLSIHGRQGTQRCKGATRSPAHTSDAQTVENALEWS